MQTDVIYLLFWARQHVTRNILPQMQKEGLQKPVLGRRTTPLGAARRSANALVAGASERTGLHRHAQVDRWSPPFQRT